MKLENEDVSVEYEVDATTSSANSWEELIYDFSGAPTADYVRVVIFFDFGKATLRAESYAELDRLIDILARHKKMKIEKQTKKDMDLLKLSLALGFSDAVTEEQLLAKVGELNTAKETLTVELADLKTKEADAKVKQITLAVESAIKDGRIQASQKESITKLMNADFEEGMDFINALEAKKGVPDTIAVQLAAANGGGGTAAPVVKDYAWYEQNDPKELVRLMNEETERYEALLVSYK